MKSFKLVIFLLCFGFISSNISFGQIESPNRTSESGAKYTGEYKEVIETINPEKGSMEKIQKVVYSFCNDGKLQDRLEITARPGQRQEICVVFGNKNTEKVEIVFGFPDGWDNGKGAILCSADLTGKTYITSLIKKTSKSDFEFSLMPKQQIIKKFYITIPKTQTGTIYGCGSFKIKGNLQKARSGNMFNIEVVKKATINIQVTGDVYNYGLIDRIQTTITDNRNNILKGLILIIGTRLVISIIQSVSKKKHTKHHKK